MISHLSEILGPCTFFSHCYNTILVPTVGGWFVHHPFLLSFGKFLLNTICLSIVWGFLPQYCWKVLCTYSHVVRLPITWRVLTPISYVQFTCCSSSIAWRIPWSNTVGKFCMQFIHCSSPITWRISCSHFILGRLFISCACCSFATFYLGLLLIFIRSVFCVLVLHFLRLVWLCHCPFSWSTFLEHHWSPLSILQSGRSLFLLDTFLFCYFILGISSGVPLRWFPSIHTSACWSYLLDTFL